VAKFGSNLIMLKFKVGTNGVLCFLDSRATHLFVNPSAIKQLKWEATKVTKPIKVHLTQGTTTLANEMVVGVILECDKVKFMKNFIICALNGMEAILKNIFLDVYYVDVLRGGFKFKIIVRPANRFISLEIEY
jgi:hypothetical protein